MFQQSTTPNQSKTENAIITVAVNTTNIEGRCFTQKKKQKSSGHDQLYLGLVQPDGLLMVRATKSDYTTPAMSEVICGKKLAHLFSPTETQGYPCFCYVNITLFSKPSLRMFLDFERLLFIKAYLNCLKRGNSVKIWQTL